MRPRSGLLTSFFVGLIGLLVTGLIVLTVDPEAGDGLTKAAFFASFFLMLSGFSVPIIFWIRVASSNREVIFSQLPAATRQGILLAILFTTLLLLQSLRSLSWWDAILVALGIGFIEIALRSRT